MLSYYLTLLMGLAFTNINASMCRFHADYNAPPQDTDIAGQVCLIYSNTQALHILNECPALEKLQSLEAILRSTYT